MHNYFPNYYGYGVRQVSTAGWTPSKVELNRKLRSLWEQHIFWTSLTVNSIVGDLPEQKETIARLFRNPADFAAVLDVHYPPVVADKFADLFRGHLTLATEWVTTLHKGDSAAAEEVQKRWYANANDIAVFLGKINPYWSTAEWRNMLFEHLRLLTSKVMTRIEGNYAQNVVTNDLIEPQALGMADAMTMGIIRQFPMAFQS